MQLTKFYRRQRRRMLNAAARNFLRRVADFCSAGWDAYGPVAVAAGEVEILGGRLEELPGWDEYYSKLKQLQRKDSK